MSRTSALVRLARLALIVAVLVAAARLIPTGGSLASPVAGPGAGEELIDAFEGGERAIVARGRSHELVGTGAPSLSFRSFSGGTLVLDGLERVSVLGFLGPACDECPALARKLATLAVVYYEDIYAVAVAPHGRGLEVSVTVDEAGGGGLVLGAEDRKDAVATALDISRRPTLAIVGPSGTLDALWTEDVPLNVIYRFLKVAYDLEGEGEKPADPFPTSDAEDG